eukprot:TRINITY_DN9879_c0_g1_i1.p1 TRINITY_DN9879_c0_g1~~TRINITY_DN9879_c0_g1_i1.p1  ORF type:complete len:157 (-),score=25.36 TRINITY_DN9879_c0_g1_i1:104-574(-)
MHHEPRRRRERWSMVLLLLAMVSFVLSPVNRVTATPELPATTTGITANPTTHTDTELADGGGSRDPTSPPTGTGDDTDINDIRDHLLPSFLGARSLNDTFRCLQWLRDTEGAYVHPNITVAVMQYSEEDGSPTVVRVFGEPESPQVKVHHANRTRD